MTTEELREQIYMLMPCGAKTDIKILKRKVKKEVFFKKLFFCQACLPTGRPARRQAGGFFKVITVLRSLPYFF
ncbi:hypothetical protein BLFGPEAP_02034 [Candidatus Methanoperedenaceae archaeon GB50]|nr:hypothetical protein BLFGPEAP_02034 [Candidatus Methanoperedenaceae archaeon GB50]